MTLIDVGGQRGNPTISDWFERWHIDSWTLSLLLILSGFGMVMLYSASGHDLGAVSAQAKRLGLGFVLMFLVAQAPPEWYRSGAGWLYGGTVLMLVLVLLLGDSAKGAQRWLDFGVMRFQPSELMKLAMPLAIAAYLHQRTLPPQIGSMLVSIVLIAVPTGLVMVQPDLGTSLLVVAAGGFALFFAGLRWRWILGAIAAVAATAPFLWMRLHDYQRGRILTLFNPERDPLGAGYHITQSKIAIGSGGTFGKGWLEGTQAKLDFLPEANTDFIFAVIAEELGLIGVVLLLLVYLAIVARGLLIALRAQDTFQRLLAAALTLKFFVYVFINIGMVIGVLPVVGVPLPLISYGGTSAVSLLVGFGMLMSIQTNRKLLAN